MAQTTRSNRFRPPPSPPSSPQPLLLPSQRPSETMAGQNHCGAEAGEDGGIDDDDVQIIEPPAQTPPCVNSGPAILTPPSRPLSRADGPKPLPLQTPTPSNGPQIRTLSRDRGGPLHSQREFGGGGQLELDGLMPVSPSSPSSLDGEETTDGAQESLPPPHSSPAILASPAHSTISQSPSINSSLLSPSRVGSSKIDLKKKKEFYKQQFTKCLERKDHYKQDASRLRDEAITQQRENGMLQKRIDELERSEAELRAELQRRPTAEQQAELLTRIQELERLPTPRATEDRDRRLTAESYNELLEDYQQLQVAIGAADKKFHEKKEEVRQLKAEIERLTNVSNNGPSSSTYTSPTIIISPAQQQGEMRVREDNERMTATIRRDRELRAEVISLRGEVKKLERVRSELAEAKSASTAKDVALEGEKKRSARLEEKVQAVEAASKEAREEQAQLKSEFAKLRTTEQSLGKEAAEAAEKAAKLEAELKGANEANGRLMHAEADLNQRVAELDTIATAMEKELEERKAELAEVASQNAQMQDRCRRAQDQMVETNVQLVKLRDEKGRLEKQLKQERASHEALQHEWDRDRDHMKKCFDEAVQAMQREIGASHALHAVQRAELERLRREQPSPAIASASVLTHQPTATTPSNGPATPTLTHPTVPKKRGRKSNYDKAQEEEGRANKDVLAALNLSDTWVKAVFEGKTLSDHLMQSRSRAVDAAESPGAAAASGVSEAATAEPTQQIEARQPAPTLALQPPRPPVSCEPALRILIRKRSQSVAKKTISRDQGKKGNAAAPSASIGPPALSPIRGSPQQHASEGDHAPPVLSPAETNADTLPDPPIDDGNGRKRAAGSIEGAPEKRRRNEDGGDGSGEGLEQPIESGGEQPSVAVSSRTETEREPAEKPIEPSEGLQQEAVTNAGMEQEEVPTQREANHAMGGDGKERSGGETGADHPMNDPRNGQTQLPSSKSPADERSQKEPEGGEGPSVGRQQRPQRSGELLLKLSQRPGTSRAVLPSPPTDFLDFESEEDRCARTQQIEVFTDFYSGHNELSFGDAIDRFMSETGIIDEAGRDQMQIVLISSADALEEKFRMGRDESGEGQVAETDGQQASVEVSGGTGVGQGSDEAAHGAVGGSGDLQHAVTEADVPEGGMARLEADGGLQHPLSGGSGEHSSSEIGAAQPANAHHRPNDKPQSCPSKASPAKQEPNNVNSEVPSVSPRQRNRSGGWLFELSPVPGTSREVSSPSNQSSEGDDVCMEAARAQQIAEFTEFYLANKHLHYLKALDEFLAGMPLQMSQEERDEMRDMLLCEAHDLNKSFRMQAVQGDAPSAMDDSPDSLCFTCHDDNFTGINREK